MLLWFIIFGFILTYCLHRIRSLTTRIKNAERKIELTEYVKAKQERKGRGDI